MFPECSQEAALKELRDVAAEVGLTEAELTRATAAAESRVANAWVRALTDARARKESLLAQEALLERQVEHATCRLGVEAPSFEEDRTSTLRARIVHKAELLDQVET
jgi:hypothetical protein